ncbi:alpha/beta fold hydrolase [Amycolatopsis taiwanensis]|uniref:alpha/beta fold hydrolase n=1 Tax=Amycolatopsis taiwanensis TaxID=342230 RepID=UPI002557900E|nr:alpha/beta hydrolase [Amycolatopsis taiwanensis]
MSRSEELGREQRVTLPQGEIRYFERGSGRPVVFVHGVLVNAELWRAVVPGVAEAGFRCIAPDWPMGAHELPMRPDADLIPTGHADLIARFLEELDLRDVIIVANDTGGALTQILMTRHPDRIERVVLTPCDCFEYFFPPLFKPLTALAKVPGSMRLLAALTRVRALYRAPIFLGWMSKRRIPRRITEIYFEPLRRSAAVRRDARKLLSTVHSRYTLTAAEKLRTFDRPVLVVWAGEDKVFPVRLGRRLAALLPDARLVEVDDSYLFISEDQPEVLVRHVVEFAGTVVN